MRRKIRLTESDINRIIRKTVNRVLREGVTSDDDAYEKWQYLLDTVGPEQMLDNIYQWADDRQIHQWIQWFEEEDYFLGYGEDEY